MRPYRAVSDPASVARRAGGGSPDARDDELGAHPLPLAGRGQGWGWFRRHRRARPGTTPTSNSSPQGGGEPQAPDALILQHPLQQLDLVAEHVVLADQLLDLAHGVEHGGVVAPAEAAADLGERAQGEHF